jgi:long-chain acyl-CoA synthetase
MGLASVASVSKNDLLLLSAYRWERERADRVFLTQPTNGRVRDWTWAEAISEARCMAAWLEAQNWDPRSRIAILSKNCAWWIMADLAIWMAGHVTVPIYPSLRAHSVRQILEHSEAKACFLGATDEKEETARGLPAGIACICFPTAPESDHPDWDSLIANRAPITGSPARPANELATIIYTSGTTGMPKGVMHSFASLAFCAGAATRLLGITAEERVLSYLPLAHIVERVGIEVAALMLGFRIFFSEGVETFLVDLHRARPTIFLSVPRLLMKFQQHVFARISKDKLDRLLNFPIAGLYIKKRILRQLGLHTVRHAACGAAPLPPEILLWYRRLGLNLCEGYGMTETLITHLPAGGQVRAGYVGAALDGVESNLTEEGELLIRSPMNMLGYYRDPENTRASFTPEGFFRTGDLVQMDPDGQIRIIGRVKELFKTSKGKYVAPAPIESMLSAHPDVESCCLMGAGMPAPFALVVIHAETRERCADPAARKCLEESLHARLQEMNARLEPFERVTFVVIVQESWTVGNGLMTPTLKIKRAAVERRYQAFIDDWKRCNAPVLWEAAPQAESSMAH